MAVDTVSVVLSRFSDTQQVNHEQEQGQGKAMDWCDVGVDTEGGG